MDKDEDFNKDTEWLEALGVEEPDTADDTKEDEKGDDGNTDDDTGTDEPAKEDEDSEGDEDSDADDSEGDDEPDEKPAEQEPAKEEDKQEPVVEDEGTRTKEAVKEALKEIETTKVEQSTRVESLKGEVTKKLYPEGLDRTLRDSDGDPITGIDDLTKLINPKTQDYFTDEEAGSWLLSAQQKLNQEVQNVEKFIEDVAETNIQLEDGAARVVEKYEKILTDDQDLKNRLLTAYNKTVVKDPKTGIAISAPVDVVEFFDIALEPMLRQREAEATEASKASKEAEAFAKKQKQADRGDLKQSGKADVVPEEDKEWAEAIKSYEEGV